jgi:hypothetical protein
MQTSKFIARMRTAATIFLLALLAFIQTPVGEVFKLPTLIEHFIKHRKQDGASLIAFLQEHYSSDHHDADLPEDEQLPFKNIAFYAIGSVIMPGIIKTNVFVPPPPDKKVTFPDTYAPQQYLGSIFHPPRT